MELTSRSLVARRAKAPGGFTLIELMIAIVIVAVLASIGLPAFFDSIRKSRRSEAFTALSALQQAQERFRGNNATYSSNLTAAPTADPPGLGQAATTPGGYYTISLANVSATGYDAVATAVSGKTQAKDGTCATLAVRMNGGNLTYASTSVGGSLTYAATNRCWNR